MPVGQLSDPFNQDESERLGLSFSGLPGDLDEPEPERDGPGGGPDPGATPDGAAEGDEVVFELDDWSDMERQAVTDRLHEATIPHGWEGTSLHVAAEDEAPVENILDIVEGAAHPPLDGGRDQVAYDLGDWDDDQVDRLVAELRSAGVAYEWDGDELYVYADDEQAVDDLLETAAHPDELAVEADDGAAGAELLGEIFVAADRLQHDGADNDGTLRMLESAKVVEDAAPPYGFDRREWERLQERVAALVDLLIEDTVDQDAVMSQAHELRSALRPFV